MRAARTLQKRTVKAAHLEKASFLWAVALQTEALSSLAPIPQSTGVSAGLSFRMGLLLAALARLRLLVDASEACAYAGLMNSYAATSCF